MENHVKNRLFVALLAVSIWNGCNAKKVDTTDVKGLSILKDSKIGNSSGSGSGGFVNKNSFDLALFSFRQTHFVLDIISLIEGQGVAKSCQNVSPLLELPAVEPGEKRYQIVVGFRNCPTTNGAQEGFLNGEEEIMFTTDIPTEKLQNPYGRPFDLKDIKRLEVKADHMAAYFKTGFSKKVQFPWSLLAQRQGDFLQIYFQLNPEPFVHFSNEHHILSYQMDFTLEGRVSTREVGLMEGYNSSISIEELDDYTIQKDRIDRMTLLLNAARATTGECQILTGNFESAFWLNDTEVINGFLKSSNQVINDTLSDEKQKVVCPPQSKKLPAGKKKGPPKIQI